MELALGGKIAVVTGASKGIGLAVTRALIAEGATVVAGARTPGDHLAELQTGGQVRFVAVDLATPSGPAELIAAAAELGGVDILINNAGALSPRTAGFVSVTDEDWERSITLNLLAAVRATRAAIPELVRRGGGSVVMISSVNAYLPDPLVIDYSAAKAALTNFAKALSKELGPQRIRVNTISPGPVSTGLWLGADGVAQTVARAGGADPEAIAEQVAAGTVTGRFTRPDEVADLAVVLASDRTGNITGADFAIDGGLVQTL